MKSLSLTALIVFLLSPNWISRLTVYKNELYGFTAKKSVDWNLFTELKKQSSKCFSIITAYKLTCISFLTLPNRTGSITHNTAKISIKKLNVL